MIQSAEDVLLDSAKRIMLDSNILIAYLDNKNSFHRKVTARLSKKYADGASFYYSQPCMLELKNHWRKKLITETIEAHLIENQKLPGKFRKLYEDYRPHLKRKNEYLGEHQIKGLRETLENIHQGKGVEFWFRFCEIAMKNRIQNLEESLSGISFKYAKFNDDDVYPASKKTDWPTWPQADSLMEKYGLSSNDAAIVNMTNRGHGIDAFISNDGDMLFAILNSALNPNIAAYTFLDTSRYL